jgi:hypothetical protein
MRIHLWLLLLAFTPASTELAEAVLHLRHGSEYVEASDDRSQQAPAQRSDSGCPLLAHVCHCQLQNAPVRIVAQDPSLLTPRRRLSFPPYFRLSSQNYLQPQQPPPIV